MLSKRRNTLRVNDLIGVAALFEPLVLDGELPDRPVLKQQFQAARETYVQRLRPLLLQRNGITEEQAATHEQFLLDDRLIRTLLLGALVPEVPALRNLTAARLHALNFGSITAPVEGYEAEIVVDRLTRIASDAGALHRTDGPDPVFSLKLSTFDPERWLDLVPHNETATGVLQQIVRDMVCEELGLGVGDTFGDLPTAREWRGRKHQVVVRFGNVRDQNSMPDAVLYATGDAWRIVIDYPFDVAGYHRRSDKARIEQLARGSHTVFWIPYFLSDEMMTRVATLAKVNYLLSGGGDRINTIAADYSAAERQQGKLYFQQRQQQLLSALRDALKQAYGAATIQPSEVEADEVPVLMGLAEALPLGDPRGGTLRAAFDNLTGDLLAWTYPGTPAFPDDEKAVTRAELAKVLHYARLASTSEDRVATVDSADRRSVGRIVNNLKLGELAESRYSIVISNHWTSRLPQELLRKGYSDTVPVHVIRALIEGPPRRGYEREVENLIMAVYALEQQLAWYERGGQVDVTSVQQLNDQMELRRPPMPDESSWNKAVNRTKRLFGRNVPEWFTPASVTELVTAVRTEAKAHWAAAEESVVLLERYAGKLGIDPEARSGRLATARRVARLLTTLAREADDVAVVGHVAHAEVGDVDDAVAAAAFKQAGSVNTCLAGAQWTLLEAMTSRAETDARAALIVDGLGIAARAEQAVQSLPEALAEAANQAAAYLAVSATPAVVTPGTVAPVRTRRTVEIADGAALDDEVNRIRAELSAGRKVRLTWEVLE